MAELAAHDTPADCWVAIDGNAYNVTALASNAQFGQSFAQSCGKDATNNFQNRRPPNSARPDFNVAGDFNGTRDFNRGFDDRNGMPRDTNSGNRDFNGMRGWRYQNGTGEQGGRSLLQQYYIGKIAG